MLLKFLLDALRMVIHHLASEGLATDWALNFVAEPVDDAFIMEAVASVARQWRYLLTLLEVNETDRAVLDAFKPSFVISDFWCGLDDAFSVLAKLTLLLCIVESPVAEARREENKHGQYAANDECLRQDEANYDSKCEKAEAGVRVVAVDRECLERTNHVDREDGIENANDRLENLATLPHSVFKVTEQEEAENDAHQSLRDQACVQEDRVEVS